MQNSEYSAASEGAPTKLEPQNRVIITVLLVSTFVVFLNETILGVALPEIMTDLGIPASTGQWLTTAFMLTMAVIIPTTGFLLQRFSTRTMYIAAMTLFLIGTIIAAVSVGFTELLIGRILQASGTAIMMPLLMTTMMTIVPVHLRGQVNGNVAMVMSVAPAIGPAISGLILSFANWHFLFVLVIPVALVTFILGTIRITNTHETEKLKLDVLSVILSAFGFSGLVYGLSSFADAARGTAMISPWLPLGFGAIMFALFLIRQLRLQKHDAALLDLRTFRAPAFTAAIALMAMSMLVLFGSSILIPIYMQQVLITPALLTGLIMLPGGLAMGLFGPFVGRLYDRHGARVLLVPGSIGVSFAFWLMVTFGTETSPWFVFAAYTVLCLGLAFLFSPLFAVSLSSVPPRLYSHASATIGTVQQLAGAAGTAMFVTVMTVVALNTPGNKMADNVEPLAAGIHAAFLVGAILSFGVVVLAAMIKKPASEAEMEEELKP